MPRSRTSAPGDQLAAPPSPLPLERSAVLSLVIVAIFACADRLPPPVVVPIPADRPCQPLLQADPRPPSEVLKLAGIKGVPAVVSRAIGHELDQRFGYFAVLHDLPDNLKVLALIGAATV